MLDQTQTPLLSALQASGQRSHAAFYAPGHKRGQGASEPLRALVGAAALRADLPELPELDNLFAPEGVIQAAQELAAAAFGADHTWFLANGSTCGIEAALLAVCRPGEKVIVPRNAHRSVIGGLVLAGAMPVFVTPDYSPDLGLALGVSAATIGAALAAYPDVVAVLLVSPTYHGFCSDIAAIAPLTRAHGIPLLVDEAHGPHLGFHPDLPPAALAAGADLVVQSTHKVLAALSQASMLHTRGDRIDRARLQAALQLTQSTSPNSLLLASLDAARQQMATQGFRLMEQTLQLARQLRSRLNAWAGLRVIGPAHLVAHPSVSALDLTRVTIDVSGLGLSGFEADERLHNSLGVTVELPELRHLTLILSLGNTLADIDHCVAAFSKLANQAAISAAASPPPNLAPDLGLAPAPRMPQVSPRDAFFAASETVPQAAALGRLSADTLSAYPPGIPAVVAGEVLTPEVVDYLNRVRQQGGYITGGSDPSLAHLRVLSLP